jgi:hypothetical protein
VVFNTTRDHDERTWKAGKFFFIAKNMAYLQNVFHRSMRREMELLGYRTAPKGNFWDLQDVPVGLVEKFSSRRNATHHVTEQAADARKVCELLGIDAPAIEAEAATAIPTPKNWASLAESSDSDTKATASNASPTRKPAKRSAKAATSVPPSRSSGKRNRSR